MNIPQPTEEHFRVLRKYFGHSQFRPMQWKIIYSIIEEKRDNCAIMATGYGKSLCYQYPAVYCEGLTIVISPLISLMQDQVLALQMSNIPACFLGSAQKNTSQSMNEVLSGVCRVLYVTPEWSTSEGGTRHLENIIAHRSITLLAIDEAHCVSQWGHDFRSAYRKLSHLKDVVINVPILAVTATATPRVRTDICCSLKLRDPRISVSSFNRPNLFFTVSSKTNKVDQIFKNLTPVMEQSGMGFKFCGPTIIYCSSKNRTEEVNNALRYHKMKSGAYHAGLPLHERNEVHEKFLRDQLDVVVATVAFGMGIDKPNVRCIIHYGLPKDIESYYQEVGRAGRDGLPAKCHIFYSDEDRKLNQMIMAKSQNQKFQEHKELMMKRMQYFCETRHCRRHLLLSYFDETLSSEAVEPKPNCCDNCDKLREKSVNGRPIEKIDLTREIRLLLEVFQFFNGRFGLGIPIKFLRGQKDAKISLCDTKRSLFGAGKEHSEAAWKALARLCIREHLLQEKAANSFRGRQNYGGSFPISTVAISQKGLDFVTRDYKEGVPFELTEQAEMLFRKRRPTIGVEIVQQNRVEPWQERLADFKKDSAPQLQVGSWQEKLANYNNERCKTKKDEQISFLFKAMKQVRDTIAEDQQCAPHMIIEDRACYRMALYPPKELKDLAEVKGFTETKIEKFGQLFLNKIKEYFGAEVPGEQCGTEINEKEKEDFLNMQRLNENAVNYFEEQYKEYLLNDEVLKDFENDEQSLTLDDTITSEDSSPYVAEKPSSSEDMWGDDPDEIFDSLPLDEIITNNQEAQGPSSSNLADKLLSTNDNTSSTKTKEKNLASSLVSMDGGWIESKAEKTLTSSLFTIDSSWKEANKKEFMTSLLSSDNDWTSVQKGKDVTASLVSVHNEWDGIKEENRLISSLVSVSNCSKENVSSVPPKKCSIRIPSSTSSAFESNIMYEDDSDDDDDDANAKRTVPEQTVHKESNKRSIPQWMTKPEAIKKKMRSNSIFK